MKDNRIVTIAQANALTESRYDFNRLEKNALYCIIGQVRKEYIEGPHEQMSYSNMRLDIQESILAEIADESHRSYAKAALINLRHRDITIEDKDGNWMNTGFITMAKFDARSKKFTVEVSSEIMPYLVDLASQYTAYSLTVAISLKSKWAQRFYELCCQYKNHLENGIPTFHKSIKQLRTMFVIENKYPKLPDLKKYVIDKGCKEIKEAFDNDQCDLWFEYGQTGKGDSAEFKFVIHTKEQTLAQEQALKEKYDRSLYIYKFLLSTLKRDSKFCEKCYKHLCLNPDKVNPLYDKIVRCQTKYKEADLAKIVRFILDEDFQMSKKTL
jgi:plasmid replication initiation protein